MWWSDLRRRFSGRRRLALVGGLALLAGGALAAWSAGTRGGPGTTEPVATTGDLQPPPPSPLLVFVSGAVNHPGLYRLTPTARVADALAAAGGIAEGADPGHLPNEAARLHDGTQVNVPFTTANGRSRTQASKLDLNSAGVEDLRALPDMPVGLAEAIVEVRERWGPFTSVGELKDALGVDRATVVALGRVLRVGPR
ncbi:MAG: ComEA family DNA-binding protein [Candidatus Dormibacteria bacterium]